MKRRLEVWPLDLIIQQVLLCEELDIGMGYSGDSKPLGISLSQMLSFLG